jgi:hexosaminidase
MVLQAAAPSESLMPLPAKMTLAEGRLAIGPDFGIAITGFSDDRLRAAAARLRVRIVHQTGLPLLPQFNAAPALTIACRGAGPAVPALGEDESYTLDVTAESARLSAPTVTGALRGMATFAQLVAPGPDGYAVPALHIEDSPRFAWRGLMIDAARHWMPVGVIERNLEAMAAVKLNVFHWHLSDDQGFRVESKVFPLLHQKGSDGLFYTQDQIRHIVAFARDRGIRVVPEFDIPGHTTAWLAAYPEIGSAPGPYKIERAWGIFEPVLDPTRDETYAFLGKLFAEIIPLFPDEYFHIGGDEVVDKQWKANSRIQEFGARNNLATGHDLQAYFNKRVLQLVTRNGRKMVGWDEILRPDLPTDIVVHSWRGQASLAEGASKGYRGILSYGYYLDHLRPAAVHYANDPLSGKAASLSAAESARILGGEACMWSEYVTAENVDSRIWPRTAAIAERLWSSRDVTDPASMYTRMRAVSLNLEATGIQHRAYTARNLERLSGGVRTAELAVLANAVEANRLDLLRRRRFTSRVPLNRLVDSVPPESESIRALEETARNAASSAAARAELRAMFTRWRDNDPVLRPVLQSSFLLREVAPISENLASAGAIGLAALGYIERGEKPFAGWLDAQKAALAEIEKPCAELTLAAPRPVRMLVELAASK